MQSNIYRRPFGFDAMEPVIAFALANPVMPLHPPRQLRRFLGRLVSDDRLVIDVHDLHKRVATAILMDNVQNQDRTARLAILGFDSSASAGAIYHLLLVHAKAELPKWVSGIDLDFCDDSPVDLTFFQTHEFRPLYATFETTAQGNASPCSPLPDGYGWRQLNLTDMAEYYHVMRRAFAHNRDMTFMPLEELRQTLPGRRIPVTLLLHDDRIVGFLNVFPDDEGLEGGEISSIGLLPEYRGRGFGHLLLTKAMAELAARNEHEFRLTAAACNETALGLYARSGFEIFGRDVCPRYTVDNTAACPGSDVSII